VAPALVSWLGIQGALIVTGAFIPVLTIPLLGMLVRIDDTVTVPLAQLARLRAIEMFEPLPAPTLELLASSLQTVAVPAGETVFRQAGPREQSEGVCGAVRGELEMDHA